MTRSRLERLFSGPVPEDDQPVTTETQAVDAMHLATDNAALEHSVADLTIRLAHVEHSRDGYKEALEAAEVEIERLQTRVAELDTVAFPTMPLPDALQAGLLLDLTDQPPAPYSAVTHAEPIEWVDVVVEPSKNGTQ